MERREKLAKIVNSLRRKVDFDFKVNYFNNRLKLQKYVFLLRRYGIDLGYSYNYYIRGPYSPELADDYYNLPNIEEEIELPEDFLKLIKNKSERWLELASSLVMVFEKYPGISEEDAIRIVAGSKLENPKKLREILRELKEHKAI